MLNRPIAVLGGGNGGHLMAADLTLSGYKVNFYEHPSFEASFRSVLENKVVELSGIGKQGRAQIHKVTTNIKEAVADADLIHLVVTALAHDTFFTELIPHLRDGHTVVLWAADLGSLRLYRLLKERAAGKDVALYETNTLAYGARLRGPGKVEQLMLARSISIAAMPARKTDVVLPELKTIFPMLVPAQNVLAVALSNPNPLFHPPGVIFNAGRIQYSHGDWNIHTEGFTEAILRYAYAIYQEVAAVSHALRIQIFKYRRSDFKSFVRAIDHHFQAPGGLDAYYPSMRGPSSIKSRQVLEDVPYGLLPVSQLGKKVGVPTPAIDGLINVASVLCEQDFWTTGRTLESLGLADLSAGDILHLVQG